MIVYFKVYTIWQESGEEGDEPSVRKTAKNFNLWHTTLQRRLTGNTKYQKLAYEQLQRLTPSEKCAFAGWVVQMEAWGFPPRVSQLRSIATELLLKKKK